jgi:hypothetical protein
MDGVSPYQEKLLSGQADKNSLESNRVFGTKVYFMNAPLAKQSEK